MANLSVRYMTVRPAGAGQMPRYFWQPSGKLAAKGWRLQRVPSNFADYSDALALHGAAIAAAEALNAELDCARESAAAPVVAPGPRRLSDLIAAYRVSDAWARLAPATQRGYGQHLARLETWGGGLAVRAIDGRRVQALLASLKATPALAAAVARVLRLLLEHGRRHGWLSVNPAIRPGLLNEARGGVVWPGAAVAAFVEAADQLGLPSIGTAIMLNEWLGQRLGDVLAMPTQVLRAGSILVRQNKTGAGVALPVGMVPHLVERIGQEQARQRARTGGLANTLLVNETTGAAWSADTFRHRFGEVRAAVAASSPDGWEVDYLPPGRDPAAPGAFRVSAADLTFMRLRHTAVTRLAECECDLALIAAVTGHSQATVSTIIERYMVRTAKMARLAFGRRLAAQAGE